MENILPVGTLEEDTKEDLVVHTGDHDNNHHHSISNTNEMEHTEEKTNVLIPIAVKLPSEFSDTVFVSKTKTEIIQA